MKENKTDQLQIRVSLTEKAYIKRAAKLADLPMSDWVLSKLLPDNRQRFQELVKNVHSAKISYSLAALNDFLVNLLSVEFRVAVNLKPDLPADDYLKNYVAAMIEFTANLNQVDVPAWVNEIKPLSRPRFASNLSSLRLHLLTHSPPPFRRRNIFIDSTIGDRV